MFGAACLTTPCGWPSANILPGMLSLESELVSFKRLQASFLTTTLSTKDLLIFNSVMGDGLKWSCSDRIAKSASISAQLLSISMRSAAVDDDDIGVAVGDRAVDWYILGVKANFVWARRGSEAR